MFNYVKSESAKNSLATFKSNAKSSRSKSKRLPSKSKRKAPKPKLSPPKPKLKPPNPKIPSDVIFSEKFIDVIFKSTNRGNQGRSLRRQARKSYKI